MKIRSTQKSTRKFKTTVFTGFFKWLAALWVKCAEDNNTNPNLQFITQLIACHAIDEKHKTIYTKKRGSMNLLCCVWK